MSLENSGWSNNGRIKVNVKRVSPLRAANTKVNSRNDVIKRMASGDDKSRVIIKKLNKLVTELECKQESKCTQRVLLKMQIDNVSRYLPSGSKKEI